MISKYNNRTLKTNLRHHEEESHAGLIYERTIPVGDLDKSTLFIDTKSAKESNQVF